MQCERLIVSVFRILRKLRKIQKLLNKYFEKISKFSKVQKFRENGPKIFAKIKLMNKTGFRQVSDPVSYRVHDSSKAYALC